MKAALSAALSLLFILPACSTPPVDREQAVLYQCVMAWGNFTPRPRLPLVVTVTEESFAGLVAGSGLPRSAYGAYLPAYDAIILSPRADRATLAHEMVHAFGVRHVPGEDDLAQRIERETRRGTACPPNGTL